MIRLALVTACLMMFTGYALADDGVLEINQACAISGCFPGDDPGFPVKITSAGSYRLTGNLDVRDLPPPGGGGPPGGIWITALNVNVNLNGFALHVETLGVAPVGILGGDGVSIENGTIDGRVYVGIKLGTFSTVRRVIISVSVSDRGLVLGDGCNVADSVVAGGFLGGSQCYVQGRSMAGYGERPAASVGSFSTVIHNRILGIQNNGLGPVGSGSVISSNSVFSDVGIGIASSSSVVSDNSVSVGGSDGISCSNCIVRGNVVGGTYSFGLYDSSGKTGYASNVFNGNTGGGPQVFGGIDLGGNVCGGDTTCP